MQFVEKYKGFIAVAVAVVVLGGILLLNSSGSDTADDKKPVTSEEEKAAEQAKKKEAEKAAKAEAAKTGTVTYTARPGDSYTVLVRKAVQAYARDAGTKVSKAQIVAAETFLTVGAGSPQLNVNQKVAVAKSTVAKAVKKAQALTASQLAAWQVYVPYVNFDTSNNG